MSNTGSSPAAAAAPSPAHGFRRFGDRPDASALYNGDGSRKYLNEIERRRVLAAVTALPAEQALFVLTLAWTGARISEVLTLTPASFQLDIGIVTVRTLKRRRVMFRELPVPPVLLAMLDHQYGLALAQRETSGAAPLLWSWSRSTAWRIVKRAMGSAGIAGRQACPRGLRHGYAIAALATGVPLNLVQRWLGHARLSTTAIYTAAIGPEEMAHAVRFWTASA